MATEPAPPLVFISYSHDDEEHKQWVKEFAKTLVKNGVDVAFDQWDVHFGDDLPKFMERGVRDSTRVLMICTEKYVAKANDGSGGVGYEAMIVTGELVRNLGVAKFIPVIRQKDGKSEVPTSVSTRRYVNFSEGLDVDAAMRELLHDLHQVPPDKPSLGKSPFSTSVPAPSAAAAPGPPVETPQPTEPIEYYQHGLAAAQANDILAWRRVVSHARNAVRPVLTEWLRTYGTVAPRSKDELIDQSMLGVTAFAPLTAVALAGVASGVPKFQNQTGQLDDVLDPPDWQRAGYTLRIGLPESGAFVYQALHGAMCLNVGNFLTAMRLARMQTLNHFTNVTVPLWQRHDVVMWPESLGKSMTDAWQTALELSGRWTWVPELFGDAADYQAAVYAYYLSLNLLEYAERLKANNALPEAALFRPHVPPEFESTPDEIKRRGYRLVVECSADLRVFWQSISVSEQRISQNWGHWTALQDHMYLGLHTSAFTGISYKQLVSEILG